MRIKISNVKDLGAALRAARKSSGVRLDDLASFAGVSKQFVSDLENGKETIRLGLALKVLDEIGLHLKVDLPEKAIERWETLTQARTTDDHRGD